MAVRQTNSNGTTTEYAADGATYNSYVAGGTGNDTITVDDNSTVTSWVDTTSGNDSVVLDSGGQVDLYVQGGGFADQTASFEVYNTAKDGLPPQQTVIGHYLAGSDSNDTITVDGSGYAGSDTYAISIGEAVRGGTAVYGGAGNDEISITDEVHISGSVDLGTGSDTISVGSDVFVEGSIQAGGDGLADTITVAEGATITDSVITTSGNDTITLAGQIGDGGSRDWINSGEGIDDVTITSTANVNVSQITVGTTEGSSLTIEEGAHVTLYPGTANPGAGILGTHGDDTIFLGGTYDSSHDTDVDGFGVSDDRFVLGADFSAINTGANSVFKIQGGGNSVALDNDTFNFASLSGRVVSHDVDPENAEHGTVTLDDGSVIEYFEMENVVTCFARGTRIMTRDGERTIEVLRTGDMLHTRDNGLQPIRWIGSRKLSAAELQAFPNLRPIRIRAGALGKNLPVSDLTVSPQHRVLVRSKIAQRMFDTDEVLVAAKHLLECDGIEILDAATEVEYFHILFDRHEVIVSNGAETESLYTGEQALKSLSPAAREEIFSLFPELQCQDQETTRPSARLLVPGRMGRQLAKRHSKNRCELVY